MRTPKPWFFKDGRYVQACALLHQYGLSDWDVDFVNLCKLDGAVLCLGECDFVLKNIRVDIRVKVKEVRQVVLHEIAHALRGVPEHDSDWFNIAVKIGCTCSRLLQVKVFLGNMQLQ